MKYKIAHEMLRVKNPEESIKFYENAFGFHRTRTVEKPEDQFNLYYLTDPDETIELELTYNYGHGDYNLGDGYGHLAIATDNLEDSWKKHKEAGYNVTDLSGLDEGRKSYYFITDPDGFKIEVVRLKNN